MYLVDPRISSDPHDLSRTEYCISCYFREGFIFANFASQTLTKISTSIHVYL